MFIITVIVTVTVIMIMIIIIIIMIINDSRFCFEAVPLLSRKVTAHSLCVPPSSCPLLSRVSE